MLAPSSLEAGHAFHRSASAKAPLPRHCGHRHPPLLGRNSCSSFRTSAAAAYPAAMNLWIVQMIMRWCMQTNRPKGGATKLPVTACKAPDKTMTEKDEGTPRPRKRDHPGSYGQPLSRNGQASPGTFATVQASAHKAASCPRTDDRWNGQEQLDSKQPGSD
jgi:hypothetical protein